MADDEAASPPDGMDGHARTRFADDASTPAAPSADWQQAAVFAAFYRATMPELVTFLLVQGVPLKDAADLAQDAMILAFRQWSTIHHPRAWIRRVASRLWARRLAEVGPEQVMAEVPERPSVLTITDVAEWEERHRVLQILDKLKHRPRQRQVLAWSLDGFTPKEIADHLQMTPEAVRSSLSLARRAIAELLDEEGGR